MNTKKDMEFKSEEEFRGVAKKAVQILLYVVESKSPLLRKLKATNLKYMVLIKTVLFILKLKFLSWWMTQTTDHYVKH